MLNSITNAFESVSSFVISFAPDSVKEVLGVTAPGIKLASRDGMDIDMSVFGTHYRPQADSLPNIMLKSVNVPFVWNEMPASNLGKEKTTAEVVPFPVAEVAAPVIKAEPKPNAGNVRIMAEDKEGVPGFLLENNLISIYMGGVEHIPTTIFNGICMLNHKEFSRLAGIIQGSPESFQQKMMSYDCMERVIKNQDFDDKTTAEFYKSLTRVFKTLFASLAHGVPVADAVATEKANLATLTEQITGEIHASAGGHLTTDDLREAVNNLKQQHPGNNHRRNRNHG